MKTRFSKSKMVFFLCLIIPVFFLAELGYPQEEDISRFPSRPISCIHPFPAGNAGDLVTDFLIWGRTKLTG